MSENQIEQLDAAIIRNESGLIIQIHRLACVQQKLTKSLVVGWSGSEMTGAHMDLRNIATQIERLAKEMSDLQNARASAERV